MIKKLALIILPAVFILLGGCVSLESVNPLSSPRMAKPDPQLEGMWHEKDDKQNGYLFIAYRGNAGTLLYLGKGDKGGIDTIQRDFFVTRTPRNNYLNFSNQVMKLNGKVQRDRFGMYDFGEYHFTWLGHLVISSSKPDAFIAAVKVGKLKGRLTYDKNGNVTDVLLKDSSERILKFIEASKPDDIFVPGTNLESVGGS